MKKTLLLFVVGLLTLSSCSKKVVKDSYNIAEEAQLMLQTITNQSSRVIVGIEHESGMPSQFAARTIGGNKKAGISWVTPHLLAVSPDGQQVAYLQYKNKLRNIQTSNAFKPGSANERTFRYVYDMSWGVDGKLYFSDDAREGNNRAITAIDSQVGTTMRNITNANDDRNPVMTDDGRVIYFTRVDKTGPSVWSFDMVTGVFTNCAIGYDPCPIPGTNTEFLCVRNNVAGYSEICRVNVKTGSAETILSDINRSYTNPSVSPDGQWVVVQGNSKSNITKKQNLDIFYAPITGGNANQLTYHPGDDCCPVFSRDGQYVYFLSQRDKNDNSFNVYRMNFNLVF